MKNNLEKVVLGGGCFWCTEAIFVRLKGIESVESGYAGGQKANPTYDEVSSGKTGHTEAIEIAFDPEVINFSDLLNVFFATHDPTTLNRQGNDIGTQYRSAIFYTTLKQHLEAVNFIKQLEKDKVFENPIVTEVKELDKFWIAESYHRRYYDQNTNKPYCSVVISPKIAKLRAKFANLLV